MFDKPPISLVAPEDLQSHQLPDPFIALSIDYGVKYIGIAKGDSLTKTSMPVQCLSSRHGGPNWQRLLDIIHNYKPHVIVVGYPLNMDGTEQHITKLTKQFMIELSKQIGCLLSLADERLSTREAKQRLFESDGKQALTRDRINIMSAQIILEQWFNQIPKNF